ncbi:hypothetical protein MKY19_16300 [Paenibacillus sp. FSL R5-0744]|uniref:hypothetical protein n=1 Tax=Paenibacillus sp. FSL R5-0744 TaxID=2921656 RepID=UPI0030DA2FBB
MTINKEQQFSSDGRIAALLTFLRIKNGEWAINFNRRKPTFPLGKYVGSNPKRFDRATLQSLCIPRKI